jgi:hypothetical protein
MYERITPKITTKNVDIKEIFNVSTKGNTIESMKYH